MIHVYIALRKMFACDMRTRRVLVLGLLGSLTVALWGADNASAASENYACAGLKSLEKITIGTRNTACGYDSAHAMTSATGDAAFGPYALFKATTGSENVALGGFALEGTTTGSENVAVGYGALEGNTSGGANVAVGSFGLYFNQAGKDNTSIGESALLYIDGSHNVGLGQDAGKNIIGAYSNNVDIANEGVASESNTTRIGEESHQKRAFIAGIFQTHSTGCFVQVTSKGQLVCNPSAAAERPTGATGPTGAVGATGPTGAEGKVSASVLKICYPSSSGGTVKTPPCQEGYTEEEVVKR